MAPLWQKPVVLFDGPMPSLLRGGCPIYSNQSDCQVQFDFRGLLAEDHLVYGYTCSVHYVQMNVYWLGLVATHSHLRHALRLLA